MEGRESALASALTLSPSACLGEAASARLSAHVTPGLPPEACEDKRLCF